MIDCHPASGAEPILSFDPALCVGSEAEIGRDLKSFASRFGFVVNVHSLSESVFDDRDARLFLIVFDNTVSALKASLAMHCPLFGFTSIVFSAPGAIDEYSDGHEGAGRNGPCTLVGEAM